MYMLPMLEHVEEHSIQALCVEEYLRCVPYRRDGGSSCTLVCTLVHVPTYLPNLNGTSPMRMHAHQAPKKERKMKPSSMSTIPCAEYVVPWREPSEDGSANLALDEA